MLTWNKPYAPSNTGYPYLLPTSAAQRGARYIDGDHEIPCQKKSRVHNAVGIIVILGDLITALSLILVLFAPSYHFTTVVLLMGTVIHFDVGLFKIHVSSQSKRIFFIFKTEKTTNAINEAVAMLNGRSLAEFESYVCMSDGFLLSHISSNCSNATALRIASILFVLVYIVSAILLVAAAIIVGISMSRNILSKGLLIRMSYLLHLTPSFLTFFGCFMYIAIGGIDLRFVSNIPFLVQDVNFVDVGIGFFLAVATATLALVNPLFAYFLTHRTIEISPKDYFDNLEIEEAEDLVGLMRSAQDRNGGGYVPPPQTNMFPYYG